MTPILQQLTINHIQALTADAYPYLYVDRITELKPGEYVKGYKNVTFNEWFFPTHFKDDPIMPGMLQIEALTQLFTYVFLTLPGNEKNIRSRWCETSSKSSPRAKARNGSRDIKLEKRDRYRQGQRYGRK
nr:3-hydroxyacyl-ACP dehydratase FabZ family protein [uncultured Helicobacter sp.]